MEFNILEIIIMKAITLTGCILVTLALFLGNSNSSVLGTLVLVFLLFIFILVYTFFDGLHKGAFLE